MDEFYNRYWTDFFGWCPSRAGLSPLEGEFFRQFLRAGTLVLDFGCGDWQRYSDVILSSGARETGLDVFTTAIRRCQEKGLNAIVHDFASPVPFPDDSCDVILCIEVLEHLFQPDRALREIYRVLKPGGVALITVPNFVYLPNRLLFMLGIFNPGGSPATSIRAPWRDPHIRFLTRTSLSRLLEECGFMIDEFNGEFSLAHFPVIYRMPRLSRLADVLSIPLKPLGRYWASVFASRFFVVARKQVW